MIRHLSRLRLTAFRNYTAAALDLDARHVVLTGPAEWEFAGTFDPATGAWQRATESAA